MSTNLDNSPIPGDRQTGNKPVPPPLFRQPEIRIAGAGMAVVLIVAYLVIVWAYGTMEISSTEYNTLTVMGQSDQTVREQVILLLEEHGFISNHIYKDILSRMNDGSLPALGAKTRLKNSIHALEVSTKQQKSIIPLSEGYVHVCKYLLALAAIVCFANYHKKGLYKLLYVLTAGILFFLSAPYITEINPDRYMMLEHLAQHSASIRQETNRLLDTQGYITLAQHRIIRKNE